MAQADIQGRSRSLKPLLNEHLRLLVAAAEIEAIGYGGVSAVSRATGISRRAVTDGRKGWTLSARNLADEL
jgi:hypothetical protein